MQITQSIDLNLSIDAIPPSLHMPQGDGGRIISAALWDGAAPYSPPDGTLCMLRFRKPDGTGGLYDTAEDGTKISLANSVATIPVALQVLAMGGSVRCQVELYAPAAEGELLSANRLATFAFVVAVAPSVYPDAKIISGDYVNIISEQLASLAAAAKANADAAAESEENAATSEKNAAGSASNAANSATAAAESLKHQPRINSSGKWELWDATNGAYVATDYTAIGKDGAAGTPGKDGTNGANGITPTIGANGNWFLGSTDTGKPSRGEKGDKGDPGTPGKDGTNGTNGKDGSDASVTKDNVIAALGYTPLNPSNDVTSLGIGNRGFYVDSSASLGFTLRADTAQMVITPVGRGTIGNQKPAVKVEGATIGLTGDLAEDEDVILTGIADGTADNDAATVRQLKEYVPNANPNWGSTGEKMMVRDEEGYVNYYNLEPDTVGAMPAVTINDAAKGKYLHVNASTKALEWAEIGNASNYVLTEADKAEIAELVVAKMSGGNTGS